MAVFRTIVYPTDFSDLAGYALERALSLAELAGGQVHCIHVVDDSYQYWMAPEAGGLSAMVPVAPPTEEVMRAAQRQLDEFIDANIPEPLRGPRKLLFGRPFLEIVRYARAVAADVIVMGTHGRGAIKQVLLGSVADKVVHKAPCPVLTVRHPQHAVDLP